MQFLMCSARIAENWLNSLKMKSPEIVRIANKLFTMTGRIMVVANGVHLPRHMLEIFVPNSKGQKTDFTGTNLHNLAFHWIAGVSAALKSVDLAIFISTNKFSGNPCNQ